MKRIIYSAAMLLTLFTTACGSGNKEASELPQIDVNTSYPEKEICLQDVAEVSYVALDSQENLLFNGSVKSVSVYEEKGFYVVNFIADYNSSDGLNDINGNGNYKNNWDSINCFNYNNFIKAI